jgi:hypothetical protein
MNRTQLSSLAVALACITALGVSATTLSSSLSSDPAEAVDLNYDLLPITGDEVADLQQTIQQDSDGSGGADHGDGDGDGSGGGQDDGDTAEGAERDRAAVGAAATGQSGGSGGSANDASDGGDGSGSGGGARGLFGAGAAGEQLLDDLLWVLALLVLAALAVRYRERIRALLGAVRPERSHSASTARRGWTGAPADANVVVRAWDDLVRQVGVADPHTLTTGECSAAARRRGYDAEAVETLRRAFDAVRYGDRPVTDERRHRVTRSCRDLGIDAGDGDAHPDRSATGVDRADESVGASS